MKKIQVIAFSMITLLFIGCEKDNQPTEAARSAFKKMFAGASQVEWEMKSGYYVADFYLNREEKEAWFDGQGVWWLTETDITFSGLPESIKKEIANGPYANWRIDDIDYIEKKGSDSYYVIEVELNEQERDLYYTPDGIFIKESYGDDDHHNYPSPGIVNPEITAAVKAKYPNARIIDVDIERNYIEIDLIYENTYWEMILDKQYHWIKSIWDYRWADVPLTVQNALIAKGYQFNITDDEVEQEIYPGATNDIIAFHFELERAPHDIHLYFKEDGSDWNPNVK